MAVPIDINYKTFKPCDLVVILCAGPTLNNDIARVQPYREGKKSVVISTNYNFSIPSDYTFYMDRKLFSNRIKKETNRKVIIDSWIYDYDPTPILKDKTHVFYRIKTNQDISVCRHANRAKSYNLNRVVVNPDGRVNHTLGNAGFGALLLSHFFSPKEVLVLGMDGPIAGDATIQKFDGRVATFSDKSKLTIPDKRHYLGEILIPYLRARGITVTIFRDSPFWGVDRRRLRVL